MSPKTTLALLLAGGSLAIGVPAALAAGGGDGGDGNTTPEAGFVQDDRSGQARPDHDCPERGGNDGGDGSGGDGGGSGGDGGGSGGDGGGSGDSSATTPEL
jgi:hypothetical protein